MHAWEMGNASFDYFFLKENCSYHLLALLGVCRSRVAFDRSISVLDRADDTVRLITKQPGLVSDIAYRPSRGTLIRRKREQLSTSEQRLVNRLVGDI